ncbi:MAG: hypothetical protein Q9187_004981 [Circinaria calcarea]
MAFFTHPTSFRNAQASIQSSMAEQDPFSVMRKGHGLPPHSSHPAFGHLVLLVFEAVLEVVCVSLPGYIVARQGMFDSEAQKFVANLNVMLFTPCLIFTKIASQLNADKLTELAVIPFIFAAQTLVSYLCAIGVSKLFGFAKRPRNFVVAMGVFGNANSLPISLVIALSATLEGLHWDKVPGDNDDEVAARGILYLLIFQQLGQLLRWSWGYHVLLAPPKKFKGDLNHRNSQIEQGESVYRDDLTIEEEEQSQNRRSGDSSETQADDANEDSVNGSLNYDSGERTPLTHQQYTSSVSSKLSMDREQREPGLAPELLATPANGNVKPRLSEDEHITSFPDIRSIPFPEDDHIPDGFRGYPMRFLSSSIFQSLPNPVQKVLHKLYNGFMKFMRGLREFMNPPLWAMLVAIVVASVPSLQRLFFSEGTFVRNSVTRAISQSGGVAVPLILVVLGANLARNTLPDDPHRTIEDEKLEKKILVAALISRMLLPFCIMAPILAVVAKYVPVSILDDPIFVIVCFLLTGAPSALQLAQICQINGVYMGVMSKLLFQSYVVWILPSTIILVMVALEVVEWTAA